MMILKTYTQDRSGTAAIEFALISSALVTLTFGIFESGRLVLSRNSLQYALENATRFALIEDSDEDTLAARIALDMQKMGVDPDSLEVNVAHVTEGAVEFIEVQGNYGFSPIVPFLPESWDIINLSANTRFPVQAPEAAAGSGDESAGAEAEPEPVVEPEPEPEPVVEPEPEPEPVVEPEPEPAPAPGNGNGNGKGHGHK